ncbi:restriction endonuclease subunit S [Campylobacter blaseri]|nr:restriction endonuclease subunit S [Campylobacter blaseri]PSM53737.1 restriction endonuclease [Campylobacter blaseri]
MGKICIINTGSKPNNIFINGKYKYINGGTRESGYLDEFNNDANAITTPSRGQGGIGFVGYQSEKFWLGALCYGIRAKNHKELSIKYLYFYLLTSNQIILLKQEGGTPAVNLTDLEKILIPIPPIDVQEKIVKILDKFDTLVNDISEGLPKEISLRTKQYEYYRDKLLNFSKT